MRTDTPVTGRCVPIAPCRGIVPAPAGARQNRWSAGGSLWPGTSDEPAGGLASTGLANQAASALETIRLHRELAERDRRLEDLVEDLPGA